MTHDALATFVERIRDSWGPLRSELVASVRTELAQLTLASPGERWLQTLHEELPASRELHRDPTHAFVLLAHSEHAGLYRPPHDHGRSWVVYALQQGELEISSYGRVEDADGVRLVKRDTSLLRPGEARIYLPGDIHDTRCLQGPSLLFRFTERDLKREDQVEHRLTRYVERAGVWTVGPA